MAHVDDTDVCPECGEEYLYEFDCRTGEYTKLSMCKCDRYVFDAEEFLKSKGLFEEFKKFHEERGKQRGEEEEKEEEEEEEE
jgi:hypothetical protein